MGWTDAEIRDAMAKVVEKAEKDEAFRKQVLSDVHGAVKEVSGKEVPEHFKINVIDGTGYHANIVLSEAKGAEDELTESDMEMVAGGNKSPGSTRFPEDTGSTTEDSVRDIKQRIADRIRG